MFMNSVGQEFRQGTVGLASVLGCLGASAGRTKRLGAEGGAVLTKQGAEELGPEHPFQDAFYCGLNGVSAKDMFQF